jgi:hypothetical protein
LALADLTHFPSKIVKAQFGDGDMRSELRLNTLIRFPSETLFPELARALNDAVSRIAGKAPRARHGETRPPTILLNATL